MYRAPVEGGPQGGVGDSQHHRLERNVALCQPLCESACPPCRGTHRPAAGAPRSPAAEGPVWLLPPSSLLREASPARAQGSDPVPRLRGCHRCPPGWALNPALPAGWKRWQTWGLCPPLSPRHRPLPHASTPGTARGPQPTLAVGGARSHLSSRHLGEPSCSAGTPALLPSGSSSDSPGRAGAGRAVGTALPSPRCQTQGREANGPHQRSSPLSGIIPGAGADAQTQLLFPSKKQQQKSAQGWKLHRWNLPHAARAALSSPGGAAGAGTGSCSPTSCLGASQSSSCPAGSPSSPAVWRLGGITASRPSPAEKSCPL